eukprot:Skav214119  [mRNA]  locus=scaffold1185:500671:507540:- [translate_table: standard]
MGSNFGCPRRSVPLAPVASDTESSVEVAAAASPQSSVDTQVPDNPDLNQLAIAEFPGDNLAIRRNRVAADIDWGTTQLRIYAVWRIPLAENPLQFRGVHWGFDTVAYSGILRLNQGTFGGIRWQRCGSLELAEQRFRAELPPVHREIAIEFFEWVPQGQLWISPARMGSFLTHDTGVALAPVAQHGRLHSSNERRGAIVVDLRIPVWLVMKHVAVLLAITVCCAALELQHSEVRGRAKTQGHLRAIPEAEAAPATISKPNFQRAAKSLATRIDVVVRSFCVVAVAEIFDKTWFVALICALNYGKKISFVGGFLALALHVFLAAALGVTISQLFTIRTLCFSTAAIFFLLAGAYLWEFLSAEASDDVIAERSSEAKDAVKTGKDSSWTDALGRVFMAVFIAEWGDRTQVAMITLHSSAPWLPVCLGSLVAFLLLTFSAVAAATLVQHAKLSERFVLAVSAVSFFVFAALAVHDGIVAEA